MAALSCTWLQSPTILAQPFSVPRPDFPAGSLLFAPQIRQVSAQVHDIRGRVKRLCQLLEAKGFTVEVDQEPRFQACNLHMIYAYRPRKA